MRVQSSLLAASPGITHGFFTRQGGVSQGLYESLNGGLGSQDDPNHVADNRARMAATLGVAPSHLLSAYQIHSPDVAIVTAPWASDARPQVDAMVCATPGIALGIATADCGPILFADAQARIVGAAHAGWKGALSGVLGNTIAAMEKLGASRTRILAAMGPMIRQPNYEVGDEFVARFAAADAQNARFFMPAARAGHALFDLPGFIRAKLEAAGIAAIDDLCLCTYADEERFFSYRRTTHRNEPDYGRLIHAIALAP